MRRAGLAVCATMLVTLLACAEDHQRRRSVEPPVVVSDAGPKIEPAAVSGCDFRGEHYITGERFFIAEDCASCRCERSGRSPGAGVVSCMTAFCDEGTRCDGGPCSSCPLGDRSFPVGTSLLCEGCNECTCIGDGAWLSTLAICDRPPPLQRCAQPKATGASTSLVYFDPQGQGTLALRVEFERGGCGPEPTLRGCYSVRSGRVRIWLEAEGELASCKSPFIEERAFDGVALREELWGAGEQGSLVLQVGEETLPFAF